MEKNRKTMGWLCTVVLGASLLPAGGCDGIDVHAATAEGSLNLQVSR